MTLAEKFGYLNTARHFFSDLFTNLHPNNVLADLIVVSVNDITREFLDQYGIEAVIWDVDGTLMRYYGKAVDDSIKDAFDALTVDKRLKHIILSNSGEERFQELGRIFPEISVLRMYESNPSIVKRKIYQHKETFTLEPKDDNQFYVSYISEDDAKQKNSGVSKEVLGAKTKKLKDTIIYDKLYLPQQMCGRENYLAVLRDYYTIIKKPDTRLVEYAMEELGITSPEKAAMVGDRAFTDITGGNQAGVWTIQITHPLHPQTDPFLIKAFARPVEAFFVKMYEAIK